MTPAPVPSPGEAPPEPTNSVDQFLFWDLVVVTALVTADWLLGPERRRAIRDRVTDYWVRVRGVSFRGLAVEDAARVRRWLVYLFGERWNDLRGLRNIAVYSASALFVVWSVLALWHDEFWLAAASAHEYRLYFALSLPINVAADWLSIRLTVLILGRIAPPNKPGVPRLTVWIFADLVAGALVAIATFWSIAELTLIADPHALGLTALAASLIAAASTLLPSALLANLLTLMVASKLLRPLVQWPTALVLERLAESDKGTLTLVSVFLGVVAKLVQSAAKAYG